MAPLGPYPVVVFVSSWAVLSGAAVTACGLFVCHMVTVIEDGSVMTGLGVAALIAGTLVKGRRRSL
jgi:hypothetical protein